MTVKQLIRLPIIDLRPLEYRPKLLTRNEQLLVGLLLVAVVAAVVLAPRALGSWRGAASLRQQAAAIKQETALIQPQLDQAQILTSEVNRLRAEIATAKAQQAAIGGTSTDWDTLFNSILVSLPAGIGLSEVKSSGETIVVDGVSQDGFGPLQQYYLQLVGTKGIAQVVITRTSSEDSSRPNALTFSLTLILGDD